MLAGVARPFRFSRAPHTLGTPDGAKQPWYLEDTRTYCITYILLEYALNVFIHVQVSGVAGRLPRLTLNPVPSPVHATLIRS